MIISLHGSVAHLAPDYAIIDVGGVGYQVFVSARMLGALTLGAPTTVYTYLAHREDAMLLYGFESLEERELFMSLISVSGVGTKTALAVLSVMSAAQVVSAIATADSRALAKVPGIGKKTAERLVLELKEKLSAKRSGLRELSGAIAAAPSAEWGDAELALLSLGYDPAEIAQALSALSPDTPVEDAIRHAIQRLSV